MEIVTDRTEYEILSILDRKNRAVNSAEIEKELRKIGIDISRRRIVQYLEILDDKGFSENLGREGRRITEAGRDEVGKSMVHTKSDYILRVNAILSTDMTFDIERRKGKVAVNLSIINENKERDVMKILKDICTSTNWAPPFIKIGYSGETLCDYKIPEGKIGLATITSMAIDGIFVNSGIYTVPLYTGLIEFSDHKPIRFINIVSTTGCSFDPLTIFMGRERSTVCDAVRKGCGLMPADYREYPSMVRDKIIRILEKIIEIFGGLIMISEPEAFILGVLPKIGYGGISALGGEILISALNEKGISMVTRTVYSTIDFKELSPICDVNGELLEL